MKLQLNFLSTTADRRIRQRLKHFTLMIYVLILLGTAYSQYLVYSTKKYMADVQEIRVIEVEERLASIEPRMQFIEKKVGIRNHMRKQSEIYLQPKNRPSVWQRELIDIATMLPPDLIISRISTISDKDRKKNPEAAEMTIEGYTYLESGDRDILSVDNFKNALQISLPIATNFSEIRVDDNRIHKEGEKLKMVFSLGIYK